MIGLGESIVLVVIVAMLLGGTFAIMMLVRSRRATFRVLPCPSCRHGVSANAPLCPHCGAPR